MCSISCLLLVVVAIFMIIFHTNWIDNLLGKCSQSKGTTTTTSAGTTTPAAPTVPSPGPAPGPGGRLRSGDLDDFTKNILSDQESFRARIHDELREVHDDQKIGLTPETNAKLLDDTHLKMTQESTVPAYVDHHTNNFSGVKELVKEKQSMTKVLSLLEEILTNMNTKKKSRNTRLSKRLNTDTYFENDVDVDEK